MSTLSPPSSDGREASLPLLQRHFGRLFEQAARLAEMDLDAPRFAAELLQAILAGTGAVAGAAWSCSAGSIQADCQINLGQVGLDAEGPARDHHHELLRQVSRSGESLALAPADTLGDGRAGAGYFHLLTPVLLGGQAAGILEIWLDLSITPQLRAAFAQFLAGMAHYAALFARARQVRTLTQQQQLWTKLEAFSRLVHSSLDLAAVAAIIANDGRALIEGDRLCVLRRRGRRTQVEAVSAVDTVDRRSNQVRLLTALGDAVLKWAEPLIYRGTVDATLPPPVAKALDAYLAVRGCRLLVVLPLRGEGGKGLPRFALVLECFESAADGEQAIARLEVIGRHASAALANAAAYSRLPLRWLGHGLAGCREGILGRRLVGAVVAGALLAGVIAALVCVPGPLKMDANGQLLPRERRWLYSPVAGQVVRFAPGVEPGCRVVENQALVLMYDTQLEIKLVQLANELAAAQEDMAGLAMQMSTARTDAERVGFSAERRQKEFTLNRKLAELRALRERTNSEEARPGYFWLQAPLTGTVLTWEFRERLTNRSVGPADPLLRLGNKERGWEVELKIPHKQLGPILEAFAATPDAPLEVDLLLVSAPTRRFHGKLMREQLAAEATTDPDNAEAEPAVRAVVRLEGEDCIPAELCVSGTEIHARIRCGDRPLGVALFHGVWEFLHEKVLFF